jgi:hypothetical protein
MEMSVCLSDSNLFHKRYAFMNIVNGTHLTIIHGISLPTLLHFGQSFSCWVEAFKSLAYSNLCKLVFNIKVLNEYTGFLRNNLFIGTQICKYSLYLSHYYIESFYI